MKKQMLYRVFISTVLVFALISSLLPTTGQVMADASVQVSVILQGKGVDQVAQIVESLGGTVTSRLDIINGVGALIPSQDINTLESRPDVRLTLNNAVYEMSSENSDGWKDAASSAAALSGSGPAPATNYSQVVGANLAWQQGDLGQGVTVAVVDTGLTLFPSLINDATGSSERIVGWKDFIDHSPVPVDPNGHGTHIAGIIANSQMDSDHQFAGIAPNVQLVSVRVLDKNGQGTYEDVIQGVDWVVKHKDQYHIRVMNLSLQAAAQSPYWADPLDEAITQAWADGITVVVAAGNSGPAPLSIGVPGNNPYVITTGAFTDNYTPTNWSDDYIAPFSSAGPTLDGFTKPDIVAPGAHMVSLMLPTSYLASNQRALPVTQTYYSMAGTSQAAAVVSGIAALVIAQHPDITPDQVKYRLMVTAIPWVDTATQQAGYSVWQQGAGRVNAPDAIFSNAAGSANTGLNIEADLAGQTHYEGYSYYDTATGQYRLRPPYNTLNDGYGVWSGGYGVWSGGYGVWSGGYGVWSGGYGVWSGGYGVWSGGYGVWSGGYGVWSGGTIWPDNVFTSPTSKANFMAGKSPDPQNTSTSLQWVSEP